MRISEELASYSKRRAQKGERLTVFGAEPELTDRMEEEALDESNISQPVKLFLRVTCSPSNRLLSILLSSTSIDSETKDKSARNVQTLQDEKLTSF